MGGSEKNILPRHIRKPGQVAKREVEAPKPFEPEVDFILFSSLNYSHNLGLYPMTHESFYDAVSILSLKGLCCESCCSCGGPRESSSVATQSQGAEGEIFSPEEACSSSRGRPREVLFSLCSIYSYNWMCARCGLKHGRAPRPKLSSEAAPENIMAASTDDFLATFSSAQCYNEVLAT